jgi:hypothetical protein
MSWLDEMAPEMEAQIKAKLAESEAHAKFGPDVMFDFGHVQAAVNIVEAAIAETQSAAQKAVAESVFASFPMDPNRNRWAFSESSGAMYAAHLTFPWILRTSMLVSICSHIEHVLKEWCRWLHREQLVVTPLGKKAKDDSDLQNCMQYLRDVAGLPITDYEHWPEWKIIDTYRLVRNCLTHDGGLVQEKDIPGFREYVAVANPSLFADEHEHKIFLLPVTCTHATEAGAKAFPAK